MPPTFRLACLSYLTAALPGSTLGLIWPSMRLSFHEPVGALGILLVFGVAASVFASVASGRLLSPVRSPMALAVEALAPRALRSQVPRSAPPQTRWVVRAWVCRAGRLQVHIGDIGATVSPGSSDGMNGTSAATTSRDAPTARENARPCLQTFSIRITPASATMAATFIAPTATNTIIRPQQQPTQYSPWWATRRSRAGPIARVMEERPHGRSAVA